MLTNFPKNMGPAVSAEPRLQVGTMPLNDGPISTVPLVDMRGIIRPDLLQVNTAAMEEPARRLLRPDEEWLALETCQPSMSPAEPVIRPRMEWLGQWSARFKISIPDAIMPVLKHRAINSMTESADGRPNGEWIQNRLGEGITLLSENRFRKGRTTITCGN